MQSGAIRPIPNMLPRKLFTSEHEAFRETVRKFYVLFWRFMIAFDCLCAYNTVVKQKASRIARGIT